MRFSEAAVIEGLGVVMAPDKVRTVLNAVAKNRTISLIELTTLINLPDSEIEGIVEELAADGLVKVTGSGWDKIITIKEQGLRAAG